MRNHPGTGACYRYLGRVGSPHALFVTGAVKQPTVGGANKARHPRDSRNSLFGIGHIART
ncbi:hypothetical protein RSAG8_12183, partial [Rhizoctonia solani AG-8 WAC10335]